MEKLTQKEEEVMLILWKIEKGFVKDVINELEGEKPPYNTISSLVRLLVKKEYVGFKQYGNTYEYFPIVDKKDYRKSIFKRMLENYFEGSYKNVASFIAKENNIEKDKIDELLKIIEKNDKSGK